MKTLPLLVWIYIIVVAAAIAYAIAMSLSTAFAGMPALLVTAPWSFLFTMACAGAVPWIFDPNQVGHLALIPGVIIIMLSAFINAYILYRLSAPKIKKGTTISNESHLVE